MNDLSAKNLLAAKQALTGTAQGKGLFAEYFALPKAVTSLSQINFDAAPKASGTVSTLSHLETNASFWKGGLTNLFAARYTGDLNVAKAGTYTFFLTSDDGSALYVDGKKIINNDGNHGARELKVTLNLSAGPHKIDLRYFENSGTQSLKFEWQGADTGGMRKVVSAGALTLPNSAPDAVNDTATTKAGTPVLINVLANDQDVDRNALTITKLGAAANGTATLENGQIRYVPKAGFSGEDQISYTLGDGKGGSDTATLRVTVTAPVATPPVGTPPPATPPVSDTTPGKQGLDVAYFTLPRGVQGLDQINFDGTPAARGTATSLNALGTNTAFWQGGATDNFAARYSGELNVTKAGTYNFYLTSDDGSALYIDGKKVIDNDGAHSTTEKTVILALAAGAHAIEIRYFENTGNQSLKLEWKGPDSAGVRGVITGASFTNADAVVPNHPGLLVEYFTLPKGVTSLAQIDFTGTPAKSAGVTELNHLNTNAAFWAGGATDLFAARYEGDLNVVNAGKYTLFLTSDDGSALYVDGQKVIVNDGVHGAKEIKVTLDLKAGAHDIEIRYFENAGNQSLKFEWQGPDSNGARKIVSGTSLSHDGPIHAGDPGPCPDVGGAVCQCACGVDNHGPETGTPDAGHDHGGGVVSGPGTDGDHDHGGGADALPLPKTAAEADAYVSKIKAMAETHSAHDDDPAMVKEHGKLLNLVPRAEATHVAIANGDWFDPDTWYEGRIPGADAKVLIPAGVSVTYDGESDASLFTVRVDGELSFATDANTKMVVDTMIVSSSGRLEIGTEDSPVKAGVTTKILIADNGDINVKWDPMLLSRGIVSQGEVEIHGAEKTSFLKVGDAPMKGDTAITLAEAPEGWRVGDTLVITGTHKTGWSWKGEKTHIESQDEEVRITKIEGNKITLDKALAYDHDAPRADLAAYVSNTTRNITVSSENGEDTAVNARGHVMFMHNDNVDVRYAAFDDLGRTDKSEDAFDLSALKTVTADSNIKGRYSLHFHETGTTDQENPALAIGNTVNGSPGWGYVQHSSNANFIDNSAFDVFGAAFAAEDGDETGTWSRNIAIRSQGASYGDWAEKDGADVARDDNGRMGDGFFFAGRMVEVADNVAANTTHGYVWMMRGERDSPLAAGLDHPEIAQSADKIKVADAPIQAFHNNEAFGTQIGLIVIKSSPAQGHDVRTVMDGFLNWETSEGVSLSYTAHYTLKDIDLIGTDNTNSIAKATRGLGLGTNAYDIVINGLTVEGFETGVSLNQSFTTATKDSDVNQVLIDVVMKDVKTQIVGFNPARNTILNSEDLVDGRLKFELTGTKSLNKIDWIYLDGTKTDAIGSRDRQFRDEHEYGGDRQGINPDKVTGLLREGGYFQTANGQKVMLVEDFVADRATGDLLKMSHVIKLNMTNEALAKVGAVNNGLITLGGAAVVAGNDKSSTQAGRDVLLDVLLNDRDPEGRAIRVDGFTDARHGDVFLQDDGKLLYRPEDGFTGTDSFSYWAADDAGHFTKATVAVDVWDM